ncbi:hypothetical protein [Streptomyces sp. MMG1121]|nr:hypothetical protein [Streptomyces sp. MMG1121]
MTGSRRAHWEFALGLELVDLGVDVPVLSEFRSRLGESAHQTEDT